MTARSAVSSALRVGAPLRTVSAEAGTAAPVERWRRSMEAAITGWILLVVALSVADSIMRAGWVEEMPALRVVALLAVLAGALLAAAPLHWAAVSVLGLATGTVVTLWQMLTDPAMEGLPLFFARFEDLWFRVEDWFYQAFHNGITTDNLPFLLFIVAGLWLAVFGGTVLTLRRRSPWLLLLALGVFLAINVSYLRGRQWDINFAFFAAGGALLVMRTNLLRRTDRWRREGTPYPDFLSLHFLAVSAVIVVMLLGLARALPRPDESSGLASTWSAITSPVHGLRDEFERIFSGLDAGGGGSVHKFGTNLILQDDISPGGRIVVRVDSPRAGLLRGVAYDSYTGRGWQQVEIERPLLAEGAPIPSYGPEGAAAAPYRDRQEVSIRLSAERSPRIFFSLGQPVSVDREAIVDRAGRTTVRVALDGPDYTGLAPELAAAVEDLAARRAAGETITVAALPQSIDGVEVDARGIAAFEVGLPQDPDALAVRSPEKVPAGTTYAITGSISAAGEDALRSAPSEYPQWALDRYLQLPDRLAGRDLERLEALARQVTAGADNAYDRAVALEGYLCCTARLDGAGEAVVDEDDEVALLYPYNAQIDLPPPRADAVSWFLFENVDAAGNSLGGYFDYHASALAVLLRSIGIPARISAGYALTADNFDQGTGTFIVRRSDAYAWVEVFVPEYGWIEFDPTPASSGLEPGEGLPVRRVALQRFVSSDVFTDDFFEGQFPLDELELLAALDLEEFISDTDPLAATPSKGLNEWLIFWPLIGVGAVVALAGAGRLAWEFSLRGLRPGERAWTSVQRLSGPAGVPVDPADTPMEHAAGVGRAVHAPAATRTIAEAYVRARFGRKSLSEDDVVEVRRAWRSVRGRLLRRILRWRVPPAEDA